MKQTIDISLFKKNPKLFFSQLPKKAEEEFIDMLEYIMYKYNIKYIDKEKEKENSLLNDFAPFRTGLPENYKFNRDEANER